MNFVRFCLKEAKKKFEMKGVVSGGVIHRIHGSIFQGHTVSDEKYLLNEIEFLPPVLSSNIICLDDDFSGYIKSPSSLSSDNAEVKYMNNLSCALRIGVVLDPRMSGHIFGYVFMIDFQSEGIFSNSDNCTVIGPSIWTAPFNEKSAVFSIDGKSFVYEIDTKLFSRIDDIQTFMTLRPGDIAAFRLSENFTCKEDSRVCVQVKDEILSAKVVK